MNQSSNMSVTTTTKPQQTNAKKVVIKRSKQLYPYLNNHYLNSALGQKSTNTRIKNEKLRAVIIIFRMKNMMNF